MKLNELAMVPVYDVPRRDAARARGDEKLIDVVHLLKDRGRGAVVVEDGDGKLAGIFTERDLMLRLVHADQDWHDKPVRDFMTPSPTCVSRLDPLSHALRLMREGGFRHLPQVDDEGRAVAILSVRDILAYIAEHFPEEFVNLPPDPSREAQNPWGG